MKTRRFNSRHYATADPGSAVAAKAKRQSVDLPELALALLQAARLPMKAYELKSSLERSTGRKLYPQTIYRLLDALGKRGCIHALATRNSFVACRSRDTLSDCILFVCDLCGIVTETHEPRINLMLSRSAKQAQFKSHEQVVEIRGICAQCRLDSQTVTATRVRNGFRRARQSMDGAS